MEQKMDCPSCGGSIVFNVQSLLIGENISCQSCQLQIGLPGDSKDSVDEAIRKLEEPKNKEKSDSKD